MEQEKEPFDETTLWVALSGKSIRSVVRAESLQLHVVTMPGPPRIPMPSHLRPQPPRGGREHSATAR